MRATATKGTSVRPCRRWARPLLGAFVTGRVNSRDLPSPPMWSCSSVRTGPFTTPATPPSSRPSSSLCTRPRRGGCRSSPFVTAPSSSRRHLDVHVERTDVPEIGWRMVDTDDPVTCPAGPWFEYHFDRWVDNDAVISIAKSPSGPQAFWHGRTLAVQFHPEVNSDTIRRWLEHGLGEVLSIGEHAEEIVAESDRRAPRTRTALYRAGLTII